jgi:hypothetical protein
MVRTKLSEGDFVQGTIQRIASGRIIADEYASNANLGRRWPHQIKLIAAGLCSL